MKDCRPGIWAGIAVLPEGASGRFIVNIVRPIHAYLFFIDSLRCNIIAANGPRGPNAARALCKERIHDC